MGGVDENRDAFRDALFELLSLMADGTVNDVGTYCFDMREEWQELMFEQRPEPAQCFDASVHRNTGCMRITCSFTRSGDNSSVDGIRVPTDAAVVLREDFKPDTEAASEMLVSTQALLERHKAIRSLGLSPKVERALIEIADEFHSILRCEQRRREESGQDGWPDIAVVHEAAIKMCASWLRDQHPPKDERCTIPVVVRRTLADALERRFASAQTKEEP